MQINDKIFAMIPILRDQLFNSLIINDRKRSLVLSNCHQYFANLINICAANITGVPFVLELHVTDSYSVRIKVLKT